MCVHTHTEFNKHRNFQHGLVHTHSFAVENTEERAETQMKVCLGVPVSTSPGISRAHTSSSCRINTCPVKPESSLTCLPVNWQLKRAEWAEKKTYFLHRIWMMLMVDEHLIDKGETQGYNTLFYRLLQCLWNTSLLSACNTLYKSLHLLRILSQHLLGQSIGFAAIK
jgi:hypothetical protein